MKSRVISILLTATMGATLLAGCGSGTAATSDAASSSGGAEASAPAASADGEDVTITYWGWDSDYYEPMFAAYSAEHPNVHFEPTATEWGDMLTKAQQALASGSELPVLLPMDLSLIENWKTMDILDDLTQYGINADDYADALSVKTLTADGKDIGVVENVCPAGIAYKRDLAKEYFGTDDPDELFKIFNSYDAYVEKGKEVADKSGGSVKLFHSAQSISEWFYFASEVPTQTDNTLNYTEKMTDVFTKTIALRDADAVDTYANGTPEANATYADDTHIFYHNPDWANTYYIEGNDPDGAGNWGLMHAPVDYSCGGTAIGITSASTDAQKQAAADFIIWATQGDGAKVARDETGFISAYKELMNDKEFSKRSDEDFFGGEDISTLYYTEIADNMKIAASSPWENAMVTVRNDVAQQIVDDPSIDLDKALELGKEELTQLVTDSTIEIK